MIRRMIGVNEDPTGSTVSARADLVLPCLDEAEALPWVLGRLPEGWRAIVVDNGSTDGSADLARSLGATVVHESRRGFGAACHAGLLAATAPYVCFCDCDGSLDPALLPGFVDRIAAGESDLVLGRRRPQSRGAWPAHARAGNLALSRMLRSRTGLRLRDLGPMRAARREALLDLHLTDRRSGYPLEMVVRASDAGLRVTETDVPYLARTGRSKVTGTWRGTWQAVRDMRAVLNAPTGRTRPGPRARLRPGGGDPVTPGPTTLLVLAKEPVPGRVKTRLTPPFSPEEAAELAAASLADTLDLVLTLPARRHVLVLDGRPGPWLPPGIEVRAQAPGGLDERIAAAFAACAGPTVLIGMDTPHLTASHLAPALAPAAWDGCDAWFGPAEDGGFWALGLARPRPGLVLGVPMSRPDTGCLQRARLTGAGLAVRDLRELRDVDEAADAEHAAAEAPDGRFAETLARLTGAAALR